MNDKNPTSARLEELEVRLYRLTTESHLAIGSGEAAAELSPVDKPIIRALIYEAGTGDKTRLPYIPASSLHGVWRAWVEKALRSKIGKLDFKNCSDFLSELKAESESHFTALTEQIKKDLGLEKEYTITSETLPENWEIFQTVCNPFWEHDKCENLSVIDVQKGSLPEAKAAWFKKSDLTRPCQVCSLFGHTGQRGRVRFTHAFPALDATSTFPIDIITRVAINRQTGAADPGKLFDLEAVPPGVQFYFFVILENLLETGEKERFNYGFTALNLNLATLGAHSTVGFGSVRLELKRRWQLGKGIFDFKIEDHDPDEPQTKKTYQYPKGFVSKYYPRFLRLLALEKGEDGEGYEPLNNYAIKESK